MKKFQIEDSILYEDKDILAVNKPAGMSVHGDGKNDDKTLADFLLAEYPKLKNVGEPFIVSFKGESITIPKPGIVHRLDKETSGVLLIAKSQKAYEFLKEQFKKHTIEKEYHAFVYGAPKEDEGIIDAPIARSGGDVRKWATGKSMRGETREAITEYKVMKRIGIPNNEKKGSTEPGVYAYVILYPKTGRTHQIRVHMKHLNHPIVADSLYAPKRDKALGFECLALHARAITFKLLNGEEMKIEAPFPTDFKKSLKLTK